MSSFNWCVRLVASVVFISGISSLQAQQYTFTNFDYPGGSNTAAYGINSSGQIAGYYYNAGWHSFLRSSDGSTFTSFDYPGNSGSTLAHGINDSGQIVGSYPYDAAGSGFLRSSDGSTFTSIDDPSAFGVSNGGGFGTVAHGINTSGQITGFYYTGNAFHGFLRSSDGSAFTSFDDPSSALPQTVANGINSSGQITGSYYDSSGKLHGFLRSSDGSNFTNFDDPSAGPQGTTAWGINDSGQIAGYYYDAGSVGHGFLRKSDGTFTNFDDPSATGGTYPLGINNSGQIVGLYNDAGGSHGFVTSLLAVPTNKDDCKNNGWKTLYRADGTPFKNQGDCIQYVNTGK
jgi:hypothetical protein